MIFHVSSIIYATGLLLPFIQDYDKRKVGCHTLNDHGNLLVDHEIIMEKSYFSYFLWES